MYTRFNDNTIETKFVKQLVAKTQVPFISTWKPGDFAIRGMVYITRDALWRCNHTGYPESLTDTCTSAEHTRFLNQEGATEYSGTNVEIPYFTKVSPYVFGHEYFNVTGSYQSSTLGYDATTHFYLGLYLRMMRDLFDLDLMPFYNCFCGEYISGFDFNSSGEILETTNNQFKIASVPVRFGKTYSISINSELPVETMLVVYGKNGLLRDLTNNLNDVSDTGSGKKSTYFRYLKTSFQHPVLYRTKSWHQLYNIYTKINGRLISSDDDRFVSTSTNYDQALGQYERYLRLLIKVPANNTSSLVVIEGDYSFNQFYESRNHNSVTWTNQSEVDTNINSKCVTGEMIRPRVLTGLKGSKYTRVYKYADTSSDTDISGVISCIDDTDRTCNEDTYETSVINEIKKKHEHDIAETGEDNLVLNIEEILDPEPVFEYVSTSLPMFSPLGLLLMSDGNSYAFSNRLVEYLLQNVINPLEQFSENIKRIQDYALSKVNVMKNHTSKFTGLITPGVWSDNLQHYLFDLVKDSKQLSQKIDLTGCVDRDTERIITRGLNV